MNKPDGPKLEVQENQYGLTLEEGLSTIAAVFDVCSQNIRHAMIQLDPAIIGAYIDDERILLDVIFDRPGLIKCGLLINGEGILIYLTKENGEMKACVRPPEPQMVESSINPRPEGGTPSSAKYTPFQGDCEHPWYPPYSQPTSPPPGTKIH